MNCGKTVRLARLFHRISGRSLIVPMDHGATLGPIPGLIQLDAAVKSLCLEPSLIQGLILHRGAMQRGVANLEKLTLPPRILHVSSSTVLNPSTGTKSQVAWVEDALQFGADAVSVHVNLGVEGEGAMMGDFGALASACQRWGMPLLSMMYVWRDGLVSASMADVRLAARVGAETGADIVKISYPGSTDAMCEVVDGCFVPVLIAGGECADSSHSSLQMLQDAIAGGAAGACIGRNLFQSAEPPALLRKMAELIHASQQAVSAPRRLPALNLPTPEVALS